MAAALFAGQFEVATPAQLVAAGVGRMHVQRRIERGSLHRVMFNVVSTTPKPTRSGLELAATLSFRGPNRYRCAGSQWGLRPWSGAVEVVVARHKRSRDHVIVHRTRRLSHGDVTVRDGRLVTTPMRTVADLAEVLTTEHLAIVLERAQLLDLLDVSPIMKALPGRHGAVKLRRALQEHDEDRLIRSGFERCFDRWLRDRFPPPRTNFPLLLGDLRCELDFAWPPFMAGVETDTYKTHGGVALRGRPRQGRRAPPARLDRAAHHRTSLAS